MKIDPRQILQNGAADNAQRTKATEPARSKGSGLGGVSAYRGSGSDSVELSNLSAVVHAYTSASPERSLAVAAIGRDLQSGRYQVDAAAVSHAIVNDALVNA